ncbi:TetR/AcrR family transcriptional regulator [Anthocerotibacter panamensis]|uniref:TetR/AcrR family transcriptional regulator n=1 Tax=Anthocerotibacter panamensis TaxID=2857077 RepID=UPI001C406458|nr:TetR/AcrR family transcriptional regulator [Anthocerotibacter panamensis]
MSLFKKYRAAEPLDNRTRILKTSQRLFAFQGYGNTPTAQIAREAGVAEGTIFRYFPSKKDILVEISITGWVGLLTELLTELSQMNSYRDIEPVIFNRMLKLEETFETMKVCFLESQFHPDLREQIQHEVVNKMLRVAEDFFRTAMDRGVYRPMNPKVVARVFLGMFTIAGFSHESVGLDRSSFLERDEMARGLTDIFLHGVLSPQTQTTP